jgi:hypothetical protein
MAPRMNQRNKVLFNVTTLVPFRGFFIQLLSVIELVAVVAVKSLNCLVAPLVYAADPRLLVFAVLHRRRDADAF